jgi:hypothetical protein
MYLIQHEIGHIAAYTIAALLIALIWRKYFSAKNYLVGLAVTLLIDADHLIDYYLYKGFALDIREFFSGIYFRNAGKVHVLFHAWEVVLLIFLAFFMEKNKVRRSWILFVGVGIFVHLVFDTLYYGFDPLAYSIIMRLWRGFSVGVLR